MGVCRLALQILTLFPSNTYEVKVKVNGVTPPPHPLGDFLRQKMHIRAIYTKKNKTRLIRRELYHLYEHVLSNKTRLS